MTDLRRTTLTDLLPTVTVPQYETGNTGCAIVHFGVGAFHRAHQAMYLDRILTAGHTDWTECGVGVLAGDAKMRDVLNRQDHLYTLITVAPDGGRDARVIGAITDYLYAPDDPQAVIDVLASPTTRIVSLTITEAGYGISDETGEFEPRDEDVLRDLNDMTAPASVFGLLTAGLALRRDRGIAPFTVMSCDNIEHNGSVARKALTTFAWHHDVDLASWIDQYVAFPSSMVDRITPATTPAVIADVLGEFAIDDEWPVRSESFVQWVLEDKFSCGRPPFENVGVQMVDDVMPYEHMKLRLLNASHQVMSYLGLLAGHTHVHEVMGDPDLSAFVTSYMRNEAAPTLGPVPGIDVPEYIVQLSERFSSPALRDTLERQIVDGSARIPKFIVPVLRDRLARDQSIEHIALTLAAWCDVYARGSVPMVDDNSDLLRRLSQTDRDNPGTFLDNRAVFGELVDSQRLRLAYQRAKRLLQDLGPRRAAREVAARCAAQAGA